MRTITKKTSETAEDVARQYYCIRWIDGEENSERLARAKKALVEANPCFENLHKVALPDIPGIPHLRILVEDMRQIAPLLPQFLKQIEADPQLHALSFVDPIRLGCEHLGIALTPKVAKQFRRSFRNVFTFDPTRSLDDSGTKLTGITSIQWKPKE